MDLSYSDFFLGFIGIALTTFFLLSFDNSIVSFLGLFLGGVSFGYFCRRLDELLNYNLNKNQEVK
jgi:hypothetical protein